MVSNIMDVDALLSEVPKYLRMGQLYETFAQEEDHTIQVPHNVLKATTDIKSIGDLIHLLRSIRYWLVDDVPLEVVEYILESTESFCCDEISEFISSFPVLQCISDLRKQLPLDRLNLAILSPYKEIAANLLDLGYEPNRKSCECAAQAGDLSLLQQLIAMNAYISSNVLGEAVKYGHLHIVQYLRSISCPENRRLPTLAARYGRLNILQYLHEHTTHPLDACTVSVAAAGGHMDCLRYLLDHQCPMSAAASTAAASFGHLSCLQLLHDHSCPWKTDTCTAAARAGHIDCLAYLHEHGCPWDEQVCKAAADAGHLETLIYAYTQGCPWNRRVCEVAAQNGNLEILTYARDHGCEWDVHTTYTAATKGHLHCLQYCYAHGCQGNEISCSLAATNGHLHCLQYLHKQGCAWDERTTLRAAEYSHLSCLQYSHSSGCDMSWAEQHSNYTRLVQQGVDTACLGYIQQHYQYTVPADE